MLKCQCQNKREVLIEESVLFAPSVGYGIETVLSTQGLNPSPLVRQEIALTSFIIIVK